MSDSVETLSIEIEEQGITTVKQLAKAVLSKGSWTTILYRYQEWDANKESYGPDKFSIRRYQKRNGIYQQKSKFNISSVDQAKKIIDALNAWVAD